MENGPVIFILIGVGIIVFAMILARLLRRTLNRQMPGGDPHNNTAIWYGASGRDGRSDDGGVSGD